MKSILFAISLLMVVSLTPLVTGCGSPAPQVVQQPAQDTHDDDETIIRALSKEWSEAQTAKDLPKSISFYADDGERLSTGSPLMTGKEDLRREWQKILASRGTFSSTIMKIVISRSSDLAYETGTYESKSLDKNKQPVTTTGKYIHVWERQEDGKWKVAEDIDNPDK